MAYTATSIQIYNRPKMLIAKWKWFCLGVRVQMQMFGSLEKVPSNSRCRCTKKTLCSADPDRMFV